MYIVQFRNPVALFVCTMVVCLFVTKFHTGQVSIYVMIWLFLNFELFYHVAKEVTPNLRGQGSILIHYSGALNSEDLTRKYYTSKSKQLIQVFLCKFVYLEMIMPEKGPKFFFWLEIPFLVDWKFSIFGGWGAV